MALRYIDLVGQTFERLTVIERCEDHITSSGKKEVQYLCQCSCGNLTKVQSRHLRDGSTKSCGCYAKEFGSVLRSHPQKRDPFYEEWVNTRLYRIWGNMISRCCDKNNPAYERYGGRGITICDEWKNSRNFIEWAVDNGYNEPLTIDRIDNDLGYYPDNCRWVDTYVQANNKRNNVVVCYNGKSQTLSEWSKELGIPYKVLHRRKSLGWDIDRMFNQPVRKSPKKNVC